MPLVIEVSLVLASRLSRLWDSHKHELPIWMGWREPPSLGGEQRRLVESHFQDAGSVVRPSGDGPQLARQLNRDRVG